MFCFYKFLFLFLFILLFYFSFLFIYQSFLDFLEKIPPAKVTWEFDNMNKVLHFGQCFRTIFMGIAHHLCSFHERDSFSGDVIGRMRIHNDLHITHPYEPANTRHNEYLKGR